MIKKNKVSLWLGFFDKEEDFRSYINGRYDEDGNYVASEFQRDFAIKKYDFDAVESDWISKGCFDVESLLSGFSGDTEIIPQFEMLLKDKKIENYNSILLLYNFDYTESKNGMLEYIGSVDVTL